MASAPGVAGQQSESRRLGQLEEQVFTALTRQQATTQRVTELAEQVADLAGFGVRVHPTGRKTWVVQSRGPRGPVRVTLGRHGEMPCEQARKEAAEAIHRIKRGEEP